MTVLVLGLIWHFIYGQLVTALREESQAPSPVLDPVATVPEVVAPPPQILTSPAAPHASGPLDQNVPVQTIGPSHQLTLPEEAQEHGGLSLSCKVELKRLCADVQPGERRLKRCYREREDQLSPPYLQQVEGHATLTRVVQQRATVQCAADVRRFCAGIRAGGGRIQQCLEDHYQELSRDCYDTLAQRLTTN